MDNQGLREYAYDIEIAYFSPANNHSKCNLLGKFDFELNEVWTVKENCVFLFGVLLSKHSKRSICLLRFYYHSNVLFHTIYQC